MDSVIIVPTPRDNNPLSSNPRSSSFVAILINPMNVVACPYQDSGKLRCCEYVPVSIIEFTEDGAVIPFDAETIDIEYAEHTQEQLEEMVANNKFEYLKDQNIIPSVDRVNSGRPWLWRWGIIDIGDQISIIKLIKNALSKNMPSF